MKVISFVLFVTFAIVAVYGCYSPYLVTDFASYPNVGALINGPASNSYFGSKLTAQADLNHDGYLDIISSAYYSRLTYIIWGRNQSMWESNPVDLSVADPSSWVSCYFNNDYSGYYVIEVLKDFNGDGINDVLISSLYSRTYGAVVIYGHEGAWTSFSTNDIDGTNGCFLKPGSITYSSYWGYSASSAGDVNADNWTDVLISDYSNGNVWVFYGSNTTVQTYVASDFTGAEGGFRFYGSGSERFGLSVSSSDMNGDGISDIIVSAPYSSGYSTRGGVVYVLYGHNSTQEDWPASISVNEFNGDNGFVIISYNSYVYLGFVVSPLYDINNDGVDDILLATYSGYAFAVFGHQGKWDNVVNVNIITNGTHGIKINRRSSIFDFSYCRGSGMDGDFNGDGISDFAFGTRYSNYLTPAQNLNDAGAVFVLYGKDTWDEYIYVDDVGGTVPGTVLYGTEYNYQLGYWTSLADVNNDGLIDVVTGSTNGYGHVAILFGQDAHDCAKCNISGFCAQCEDGFKLHNATGTCSECSDNYWSTGVDCHSCAQNGCAICVKEGGMCLNCTLGYEINSEEAATCNVCSEQQFNTPPGQTCVGCILGFGCSKCDMTTGLCRDCPAGKILNGLGCSDCPEWTYSIGGTTSSCSTCSFGAKKCSKCDSRSGHCMLCESGSGLADDGCTVCGKDEYSDGASECTKCALDDGCLSCNNTDGMCLKCPTGKGLFGEGCIQCTEREYVVDGYCQACILKSKCTECDVVTGLCSKCTGGYFPWGDGCVEIPSDMTNFTFSPASKTSMSMFTIVIAFFISLMF